MFFLKTYLNSNLVSYKILFIAAVLCVFSTTLCFADPRGRPGVVKKKYKHACPAGTEQVGDGPPKSSVVFCRAMLQNGYRLEGEYVSFYRNGNIKMQGEYVGGKRDGKWNNYRKNGQLVTTSEYRNGNKIRKPVEKHIPQSISSGSNKNAPKKMFSEDKEVQQKLFETRKRSYSNTRKNLVYGISGN